MNRNVSDSHHAGDRDAMADFYRELPLGQLSVLEIDPADPHADDLNRLELGLIRAALDAETPVFYAHCGPYARCASDAGMAELADHPLFGYFTDAPERLFAPGDHDWPSDWFLCGPPNHDVYLAALDRFQHDHGPAFVVLDDVCRDSPFDVPSREWDELSKLLQLKRPLGTDEVDRWQAWMLMNLSVDFHRLDNATLAVTRSQAATMAPALRCEEVGAIRPPRSPSACWDIEYGFGDEFEARWIA